MRQNMHVETRLDGSPGAEASALQRGSGPRLVGPPSNRESPSEVMASRESPRLSAALPVVKGDERIDRVAQSRISVMIVGETGAGKELVAQRLHESSPRATKPFVAVNCAAFCGTLIESELFGYERGAFTGADRPKMGLVEQADGGTLFLDEVAELVPAAQTKLLRVLETRQVTRLGAGTNSRSVDVRFVAATNVDLDAATAAGRFREDLLYRLDAIRLHVVPLRRRVEEIIPAALQFLREFTKREQLLMPTLTRGAESALQGHEWPGNFRELRNVIERAVLICNHGQIHPTDLMLPQRTSLHRQAARVAGAGFDLRLHAASEPSSSSHLSERERIVAALRDCAGNQTRASRVLGISRRTLISRLEAFALARPRPRGPRVLTGATTSRDEALAV